MYNPLSIARLLTTEASLRARDYIVYKDMWHTWLGDGELSRLTLDDCLRATDEALTRLHEVLAVADNLFITLGTDHYYLYEGHGEPVANCHRLPAGQFAERRASLDEMVARLGGALDVWHERNPRLRVVLTVSPYRYAKYGMHGSQLSKARLLLCADALCEARAGWVEYFPSYEIVMDELRDYRFYAEDMLHPSDVAVQFIWQRLAEAWMDDDVRQWLERWYPVRQALSHRPLHPESPEYAAFKQQTQTQVERLRHDYPTLELKIELVTPNS